MKLIKRAAWGYEGYVCGSAVKNPPAMRETWVQSLGRKDPLEEGMATHSSTLAWRIPWTEEPVLCGLQSTGLPRVGHNGSELARRGLYLIGSHRLCSGFRVFELQGKPLRLH